MKWHDAIQICFKILQQVKTREWIHDMSVVKSKLLQTSSGLHRCKCWGRVWGQMVLGKDKGGQAELVGKAFKPRDASDIYDTIVRRRQNWARKYQTLMHIWQCWPTQWVSSPPRVSNRAHFTVKIPATTVWSVTFL